MNIFQELKEKKVLDKDGKVDALGPYGKMKLTGQEVAQYFKKNKVRDKDIKKAVEVALDLGGAMSVAQKEIKKFFGNKILKSKEVQHALKYANEEFQRKESESISEARAMKLKDIARKYKREIEQLAKKGRSPEMGKHKVYMALYNLAWENGDINTDDPDQTDEVIDDYMDDMMGEFFAHIKEGFKSDAQRRAAFASGYKAKGKKDKKEEVETLDEKSKDVRKRYRGKEQKSVNSLIMQNGVDKIQKLFDDEPKEFDALIGRLAKLESVQEEVTDKDLKNIQKFEKQAGSQLNKMAKAYEKIVKSADKDTGSLMKGFVGNLYAAEDELRMIKNDLESAIYKQDSAKRKADPKNKADMAKLGKRLGINNSVELEGETITEGKNLMPDIQKIVDTKGAAKVGGVMLDMFTASVITQAYEKVNDSNKKKMEKANIQTLVRLAQKMMGMKESEDKDGLDQNMKDRKNKKHVMDALEKKIDEWIAADGSRRRVHEKDKRKCKNVMDSYRNMWEDAIEEDTIVEKKEMNPKVIEKIAKLTDRNDHNESLLLLAKELRDKEAVKLLGNIKDMHKVYGHMPQELIGLRNAIFDNLMRQSKNKFANHQDVYGAL